MTAAAPTKQTDMAELSSGAQGLVHALEHAAQSAAAQRGAGYPVIDEDQVGGLEAAMPAIEEMRVAGFKVTHSQGERGRGDRGRVICLGNSAGGPLRVVRQK